MSVHRDILSGHGGEERDCRARRHEGACEAEVEEIFPEGKKASTSDVNESPLDRPEVREKNIDGAIGVFSSADFLDGQRPVKKEQQQQEEGESPLLLRLCQQSRKEVEAEKEPLRLELLSVGSREKREGEEEEEELERWVLVAFSFSSFLRKQMERTGTQRMDGGACASVHPSSPHSLSLRILPLEASTSSLLSSCPSTSKWSLAVFGFSLLCLSFSLTPLSSS